MKILLCLVGLIVAFSSYCQSLASVAKFDKDVVDMGKLKQDPYTATPPVDSIRITNIGKSPLKIDRVTSSSGALGVKYDNNLIAVGQTCVVRFAYQTRLLGPFSKSFTIGFDGIAEPKVITVKGEVVSPQ